MATIETSPSASPGVPMADSVRAGLTDDVRKAIFAALVEAQDRGIAPARSRQVVGDHFRIPYQVVAEVEAEGLDQEWPPLGDN